jgi:sugar phosphate isomerase/epimerase
MRIAISNIAWDVVHDEQVAQLLLGYGINAIDIAPGKYFPAPASASEADILEVKGRWAQRGISIVGMQALLFGTNGLNVFGPADVQRAMLNHLDAVCRIGGVLGATKLVFGSPKNRDRGTLSDSEALAIAIPFFRQLGDIAASHGVVVCLEPNPPRYGANFMTTAQETAVVVKEVAHPAIKMQFDSGAIVISGEDVGAFLEMHAHIIGHVHISEPDLVPIGDGAADHATTARFLRAYLPQQVLTIEMLVANTKEPHLQAIERAIKATMAAYGAAV